MDELELSIREGKEYVRDRITELRIKEGISEYQLSLELGQNKGYIQSISSGKALPSMTGFFNICDYFRITPAEFFKGFKRQPRPIDRLIETASDLSGDDLNLLIRIAERMKKRD